MSVRVVVLVAVAASLATGCSGDGSGPARGTRFVEPLEGALNQKFFYFNYVDEASGTQVGDYNCGLKTYDGHKGTDISLANFAVMDSGVAVHPAAAGTVVATHDGEFDRQKAWIAGTVPNYVVIRHRDGLESFYLHLKRNSVAVSIGQEVKLSDVLGYVGSSGYSDIPHLHFEVHGPNGDVIDPWAGSCGSAQSRWSSQLAYQNAFSLYSSGLTNQDLTLDLVKDPPANLTQFTTADPKVGMWVELMNVPAGAVQEFRLYQPDGALYFSASSTLQRFYGISWWWAWHAIPGYLTPGTWRMEYRNNGVVLAQRVFTVVDASVTPVPRIQAVSGIGGGNAGADWAWWPEQSSKLPGTR